MSIEITERGSRGFHQYGDPVQTSYGDMVEVYESSSAHGPHCWLRLFDDGDTMVAAHKGKDYTAHLSLAQAVAVRNRLDAFINEAPERWNHHAEH